MKPWPTYSSNRGKLFDLLAGFVMALLVNNAAILFLTEFWLPSPIADVDLNTINMLPWLINGLFLLVFLIILPYAALGYLVAATLVLAIPQIGNLLFTASCLVTLPIMVLADLVFHPRHLKLDFYCCVSPSTYVEELL